MKTVEGIFWLIFGGAFLALVSFALVVYCFATIILIPIGFQWFKLMMFCIWPIDKEVVCEDLYGYKIVLNSIWAVLIGWWSAAAVYLVGGILYITFIGIPLARQYFKIAQFIFSPLGHDFE